MTAAATPFSAIQLREELFLEVSEYLPPRDLLAIQCVSKDLSKLDLDSIWRRRCLERWEPWPRYRLTTTREEELSSRTTWKQKYWDIEKDATRSDLCDNDLLELAWYIKFLQSGVQGADELEEQEISFSGVNGLEVPGYPPLYYEIVNEPPCSVQARICRNVHGDLDFNTKQFLQICNFPAHCIARRASDAEWFIANENVAIVSRGYR